MASEQHNGIEDNQLIDTLQNEEPAPESNHVAPCQETEESSLDSPTFDSQKRQDDYATTPLPPLFDEQERRSGWATCWLFCGICGPSSTRLPVNVGEDIVDEEPFIFDTSDAPVDAGVVEKPPIGDTGTPHVVEEPVRFDTSEPPSDTVAEDRSVIVSPSPSLVEEKPESRPPPVSPPSFAAAKVVRTSDGKLKLTKSRNTVRSPSSASSPRPLSAGFTSAYEETTLPRQRTLQSFASQSSISNEKTPKGLFTLTRHRTKEFGDMNNLGRTGPGTPRTPPPRAHKAQETQRASDFSRADSFLRTEGNPEGAYFVFDPAASNGTAFLTWSKTEVKNALAFARPSGLKQVPAFKFAKGGKNELCKEINKSPKEYYRAWTLFLREIRAYNSSFIILPAILNEEYFPVFLAFHEKNGNVVEVKEGEEAKVVSEDTVDGIMAIPVARSHVLRTSGSQHDLTIEASPKGGMLNMDLQRFIAVGQAHGSSVTFIK